MNSNGGCKACSSLSRFTSIPASLNARNKKLLDFFIAKPLDFNGMEYPHQGRLQSRQAVSSFRKAAEYKQDRKPQLMGGYVIDKALVPIGKIRLVG